MVIRLIMGMLLAVALLPAGMRDATAAEKMRFWNLTNNTIDQLYLAPAGTTNWGPNQCLNDDDKSVDSNERLQLRDVKPGQYDVRFVDAKGRQCVVKNVEVKGGKPYAFSIEEKELTDCTK